jgi:hypothetical protein
VNLHAEFLPCQANQFRQPQAAKYDPVTAYRPHIRGALHATVCKEVCIPQTEGFHAFFHQW